MEIKNLIDKTFRGKKVFITGHTGFKGSWLTVWLQKAGANVKGYSLKPERESLFRSIEKKINCETIYADIRIKEKLESEILKFKPDFVFHLAAQSLVRRSYKIPLYTFETNTLGTANLLQSLFKLKQKCAVIVVTTDKVYENTESLYPYKETDRLGGHDPYSSSKACAEIITNAYCKSFFYPENYQSHKKSIATVRAGNVIGGGDYSEDRLIPDIVRALKGNKTIILRNPESVRPWQYVLEPLSGYLLLAALMFNEPVKYQGSYNFGPETNDLLNVESVVKLAIKHFGKGKYKVIKNKNAPHEATVLRLDINKVKNTLGWKPYLNTNEALVKTIDWYRNSIKKNTNAFDLCVNDINDYLMLS